MADAVPKIRVTDPQSRTSASANASPSQSPVRAGNDSNRWEGSGSKLNGDGTTEKSPASAPSGRITPNKLLRNLSSNAIAAVSGQGGRDVGTPSIFDGQTAIDPLSQQIMKRTNMHNLAPQKPRSPSDQSTNRPFGHGAQGLGDSRHAVDDVRFDGLYSGVREKRKGVSFLSRLIPNKKKEAAPDDSTEDQSELGGGRPEGMDAELFYQPIDNMGFSPRHPQPPGYIKVRSRNKKDKFFDRLFLAQELRGSSGTKRKRKGSSATNLGARRASIEENTGAIWAMEFSKDGKYLAAGGQDKVVRVWSVIATMAERRAHEKEEDMEDAQEENMRLSAPVFRKKPVREYEGHTASVLDLSWSKNNFILSSSMDKTVRLWHVSRAECLCAFKHSDFVTSIQFHPRDDRFFLAGSLDSKLRLWSIPDKSVAFWNQVPDLITAVAFTPDGKSAIAGCLTGLCVFYETEGMKYQTQIHVRSTHGKNARGSKITGIQAINMPPDNMNGEIKLLITSNDSRVRLYNFRDKSLELKFKGHENSSSQIHATFSDDARFIICGSEDRKAYIWDIGSSVDGGKTDKRPVEMFEAHTGITTVALLAPVKTRQLLSGSEDPLYDLCNPPPVTLVSRSESTVSIQRPGNEDAGSIQQTPATAEGGGTFKKPLESPAYIARCAHQDGNLVVTSDANGRIKVFRQDCAHNKRRSDWDSSSVFSKRVGTSILNRSASIATRNGGRLRAESAATQPSSDRIMSWRQSIAGTGSSDTLPSIRHGIGRQERSMSPRKSNGTFSSNIARTSNGMIHRHQGTPLAETPLSNVSSFTSAPASEHEHKSSMSTNDTSTWSQSPQVPHRESGSPHSHHSLHLDQHHGSLPQDKVNAELNQINSNQSAHPSHPQANALGLAASPSTTPFSPSKEADDNDNSPNAISARWQAPSSEESGPQGGLGGFLYSLNLWREQLSSKNSRLKPPEFSRVKSQESAVSRLSSEESSVRDAG